MDVGIVTKDLLKVKKICDQFQIPLGVYAGTLLGIVRDNCLMPWDHDIDLWFPPSLPQPKFQKLMGYLKNNGFPVWETFRTPKKEMISRSFRRHGISIGCTLFVLAKDPKFICKIGIALQWKTGRRDPTAQYFPKDFFSPPKEIEFKGKVFLAPNPVEEYLTLNYGNWRKKDATKGYGSWRRNRKWRIEFVDKSKDAPWPTIIRKDGKARKKYYAGRK